MPQRLVINPRQVTFADLAPAARVLLDGGLVAGPTQTFYALMVLVDQPRAMEKIIDLKGGRERKGKPFLILLDQEPRVFCYAREIPEEAKGLIKRFWPGPLTLLFLAQNGLHPVLVGPARTVALRLEGLTLVRSLIRQVDRGLTGTSANPSGSPPPVTPDEVLDYFGDQIDLIIDAGLTLGGPPTTIIDVSLGVPRVIRDGELPLSDLIQVCPILRLKT